MRRLACLAGGFAAAVFAFVYLLTAKSGLLLAALCAVLCVGLCCLRRDWARRAALLLAGAAIGLAWCAGYWHLRLSPLEKLDGRTVPVVVTAVDYSLQTPYGSSVQTEFVHGGRRYGAVLYAPHAIYAQPGDTISANVMVHVGLSQSEEDGAFWGSKGVNLRLSLRGDLTIRRADAMRLRFLPVQFAHGLRGAIAEILDEDTAPFIAALVTGDRSGFDFALKNNLSVAGLYHAVAISGMHVSILLGILLTLLGSGRRRAAFVGLPIIWFYAFAVGAGAPVVRAAVMLSFLLLAPLVKRENDTPTSLLAALALILIINPWAARDVSLQLSFASITGILVFSQRIFRFFWDSKLGKRLRKRSRVLSAAAKVVLATLASSLAVMPTTLPLSAVYFGMFSVIAPLSSVLVLPVISLCFSYGILAGSLGMLLPQVGRLVAWPLNGLVRYCMGAAARLAKVPFAAIYTNGVYMAIFLAFVYCVILYFTLEKRRAAPLAAVCGTAMVLCLCLLLGSAELDRAALSVCMLDVGQGQCVYLECGGVNALYDCGGSGEGTGELAIRYLKSIGRSRLDYLVISHYDSDHAEGAAYLLSRLRVGTVLLTRTAAPSDQKEQILQAAAQAGTAISYTEENRSLPFGGGTLRLFAPVSDASDNDGSQAALLSAGDFDVLLTGDMSGEAERTLLLQNDLPDIEVLAAGHHGAKTSTSSALLRTLRPEAVLISVGRRNSYGHPAPETLTRLSRAGARVYRTDQCGNIILRR